MRRACALVLALLFLVPMVRAGEDGPVTRGEFVTALWESDGGVPMDVNGPFPDVRPEDPCAAAVAWACGEDLIRGVGGGLFAPGRAITREECAVLLRRWAGRLGRSTFLPDGVAACNDYEDISPWADDSLYWATDVGLIDWSGEGRLDPLGTVTKAQVDEIIHRFIREQP